MSINLHIKKLKNFCLFCSVAALISSCNDDFLPDSMGPDDVIQIDATVDPTNNTRGSYIESGTVNAGTYLLHYRNPNYDNYSYFNSAFVDFGHPEGPNIGFAYFMDGDKRKDLKWRHVLGEGSSQTFYLSNLKPETFSESNYQSYKHVMFSKTVDGVSNNPYVASPLDEIDGTNDLLLGSTTAGSSTGRINFTLSHILSLLKINVEVYAAKSDLWSVNLENARIFVSNLCTRTSSVEFSSSYRTTFYYNTGNGTYSTYGGTYNTPANVSFTDPQINARKWAEIEEGVPVEGYDEDYTKTIYRSQRFVFPPQSIPPSTIPAASTGYTGRPVLTVRVPKYDATGVVGAVGDSIDFTGNIPDIMFDADNEGNIIQSSPQTIALRSGYQLTVTAYINSPETVLTFAPVRVERWVSKGNYTIKTKQGGINTASDFYALIEAYNSGDEHEMLKFGYKDADGKLVFQLWSNIKVDWESIKNKMVPNGSTLPDFSFMFNGFTVTLQENEEDKSKLSDAPGQYELYNIVTGKNTSFDGIQNASDMRNVINLLTSPNPEFAQIIKYGYFNNMDNNISFEITNSFEISVDDLFQKLNSYTLWDYDLQFNIPDGKYIRVTMPDNPNVYFDIKGSDNFDKLNRLLLIKSNYGISSANDFYFLVDCYNKYYKYYRDIMKLYAQESTNNPGQWTIRYTAAFTLDGNKAYMSMIPDPDNGKPQYSVQGSNYSIVFDHDIVPCTCASIYTYPLLSGNGSTSTGTTSGSNVIGTLATAYNNNNYTTLWDCGRFDFNTRKWTFNLSYTSTNASQYVAYSSIFGKMIPDPEKGKFDYDFELKYETRITSVNPSSSDIDAAPASTMYFYQNGDDKYNYPNTAADFKLMALGNYWIKYREWLQTHSLRGKKTKSAKRK